MTILGSVGHGSQSPDTSVLCIVSLKNAWPNLKESDVVGLWWD